MNIEMHWKRIYWYKTRKLYFLHAKKYVAACWHIKDFKGAEHWKLEHLDEHIRADVDVLQKKEQKIRRKTNSATIAKINRCKVLSYFKVRVEVYY